MRELEMLKDTIEKERKKLNDMMSGGDMEAIYTQSVKLDGLIARYIDITE